MPGTRRTSSTTRSRKRITPEILELYRRACASRDRDPEGYHASDACMGLYLALGRRPWVADIFEALDEHRDTEITKEMIVDTRGHCVVAQWGLIKAARDLGLELERLDREAVRTH
jgi:hypothetical protein